MQFLPEQQPMKEEENLITGDKEMSVSSHFEMSCQRGTI